MKALVHGWVFGVIWASWANWVIWTIWAIWGSWVIWAIAGFGLSKHVIRYTPPRMVFVSVRFLLRSIHVPSSQRSFVVST